MLTGWTPPFCELWGGRRLVALSQFDPQRFNKALSRYQFLYVVFNFKTLSEIAQSIYRLVYWS
jgi:hypothetical protein